MQEFIRIATHLANTAGDIARQYFRTSFEVTSKADASPVTIADQSIERALRDILARQRPNDTILGEEFDTHHGNSGLTWVIDPIDGTKSFVMGRPTFGTLIALWDGDTPLLGIIDQPILRERWIGTQGHGTTFNGAPVTTRPCPQLKDAIAASTTPAMFTGPITDIYKPFEQTCSFAWGSDCYGYGLLASGHMDLMLEADLKPHDFAALIPIIQEAGGHITDYTGQPITLASNGQIIALGDPSLWPHIKPLLTRKDTA